MSLKGITGDDDEDDDDDDDGMLCLCGAGCFQTCNTLWSLA
jgi:hypothetical protein